MKILSLNNKFLINGNNKVLVTTDPILGENIFEGIFYSQQSTGMALYDVPEASDVEYTSIVYIDPSQPVNGVGTELDPLNDWPEALISNTAYLQKRGTTYGGTTRSIIQNADNVLIGAYGVGTRPNIGTESTQRIEFRGDHAVIRDVQIRSINVGEYPSSQTDQHWVYNCEMKSIGFFASTTGSYIIGNELHDSGNELIWVSGAETDPLVGFNIEIAYNKMYDANTNWFPGATELQAPGDAIQFKAANGLVHIHNNFIDRSSTGNKFNIILGEPNTPIFDALVEDNIFYPPMKTPEGGAVFYVKSIIDTCTIRNNIFYTREENSMFCIYTETNNCDIYGNLFINFANDINIAQRSFFNNTVVDVDDPKGYLSTNYGNNIFSTNQGGNLGAGNLYIDTEGEANLFESTDTYKLKVSSPARDAGTAITGIADWIKDFYGTTQEGIIYDMGAFRYKE